MDRRGRDQFAIRYGDETEIYWNDHQKALAEEVSPPSATCADTPVSQVFRSAPSPATSLHPVLIPMPVLSLQVYKRSFWTESFVQWSPKGSYLGTVHTRGVAVWGGPSFARLQRFTHTEVGSLQGHPVWPQLGCSRVSLECVCQQMGREHPACVKAAMQPIRCVPSGAAGAPGGLQPQ